MGSVELFLLAAGLAMDAFAVSICKGLSVRRASVGRMAVTGLWFGGFQALMPVAGYLLGAAFETYITAFDHWIAFVLLALIGANMIRESFADEECCQGEEEQDAFSPKAMFPLAVATSIDALAVGVTFAFLQVDLPLAVGAIGVVTFLLSAAGVKIGNLFGARFKAKAEIAGGVVLVLLGLKILLEHLGFLA